MLLRVLHLSDIHFSTKRDDELFVHNDVRNQLINDLRTELIPRLGRINTVLLAGDVAFSGKRTEYERAADWLEHLCEIGGCPRTAVLTVPGNHDVDRTRIKPTHRLVHRQLRNSSLPEATRALVELAESNDGVLTDKLTDYQAFAASYGCQFRSTSQPHWIQRFDMGCGRALNFVGLTTVQVCDVEDQQGAMLLGPHQYILDREAQVEHVAVMHHPLEWLKDRREAHQYLSTRARILIFGHEHVQDIFKITDANHGERLVIGSGAVTPEHAADPFIYRYNILEFDSHSTSAHLSVTVYPRIWIPERTLFAADSARLGGRDATTFQLACPQYQAEAHASPSSPADSPSPRPTAQPMQRAANDPLTRFSYFFWRYLTWQQRLQVLVQGDVLPTAPEAPIPQAVEQLALLRAQSEGKLGRLWDLTMQFIPVTKRETNPFAPQPTN